MCNDPALIPLDSDIEEEEEDIMYEESSHKPIEINQYRMNNQHRDARNSCYHR